MSVVAFLTLAVMELIVFIVIQLLMEVQSYTSPTVKISPDVIRESSSVKISCETPADVTVNQCYFYTNSEEKNVKTSWRCELDLTGAEVFRWAAVTSPGSLDIYCYYTIQGIDKPSRHSPPATVMVLAVTVMSTSETLTYTTTDLHSKTNLSTSTTKETMISITNSTLPGNSRISEHTTMAVTFTTASPRTAVSSVHTSMTHPTDPQTGTWFLVLVSTGVAVFLSVLTGLICLCRFASQKRRKLSIKMEVPSQGISMSGSGSAEIYSLITSVPETSQPISGGLEHPESNQESTADPTDTHSFIMYVNSVYQPSDVLVNKQQKQGNPEENENVYHLYSMIPDKPVHSNAEDHVYSLVKMH
ncbi:uncharacterized protein LOC107659555 [Sinocyclocheilus anshuiensis]|uniref:uncharacterized protein LOC107659555 n=1 Tax=Sinocyclocheilus anshuiensis TaxID=1608454 RepID=UPI0007B8F2FA|nr:PREDICTED: uncharacterized protein LOC107659555 [Sinocyclocheilus anshuiensis]